MKYKANIQTELEMIDTQLLKLTRGLERNEITAEEVLKTLETIRRNTLPRTLEMISIS